MSVDRDVPIFVDLQGFVIREKFTVKEVAVLRNGKELIHHVFRAPLAWDLLTKAEKSRACWLTANHHGLKWNDGDVNYVRARTIIRRAVCDGLNYETLKLIYVKGAEKKGWLEETLGDAVGEFNVKIESMDVEYEDIGRLETLGAIRSFLCGRHAKHCAMENVCKLHDWWAERRARLDIL